MIYFREAQIKRLTIALAIAGVVLAACAQKEDGPATTLDTAAAAPDTTPAAPAGVVTPAPDARIGTMQLKCGSEDFRVAFENARAVVVADDGANTDLPKLEPQPGSPTHVATFTDGVMTFTREGGGDRPTVIKYARGRMAFQDCAVAQN